MSNSFVSPPTIADPQTVVTGQPISSGAITALGQSLNYAFGVGGITNIISQAWGDGACSQSSSSFQEMCEWMLPMASSLHLDLEVYLTVRGSGEIRLTLDMSGTPTIQTITTSGGSASIYSQTLSVASFTAAFATLTLEARASSGTLKIVSIMARWAPLSSPLPSSNGAIMGQPFKPFGIDRLATENPLSARVGYNMLNDISSLRGRLRTWASWSAVSNANQLGTGNAAPAEWLGVGDLIRLISPTHIHWAETMTFVIYCALRVEGITTTDLSVDIFGYRYTISANGWTTLALWINADAERSSSFKLPIYRVGIDASDHNLNDNSWNIPTLPAAPIITGVCIWGP